jgi:hypothetical protein
MRPEHGRAEKLSGPCCFTRSSGSGQPGFHRVGINETGLLVLKVAVGEDGEVWDALDVEARGKLGVAFGVNFEHDGLAGHFLRDLCHVWRSHAARTAPRSPEIDEDRNATLANDLIEFGGAGFNWFGDGWQSVFAGSASAGVGKVLGGDAV